MISDEKKFEQEWRRVFQQALNEATLAYGNEGQHIAQSERKMDLPEPAHTPDRLSAEADQLRLVLQVLESCALAIIQKR